jgi:MoaA/NifB/PqqE/SkfB family radical SAM enzyme
MNWIPPNILCLSLVDTCNLKCTTCYSWKKKFSPDPRLPLALRTFLFDFASKISFPYRIVFSGGETLLDRDIVRTLRYCSELGFDTQVTTNGTLLEPRLLDELLQAGLKMLTLPLEGITAEVHDRIRPWGSASHFELVHSKIEQLSHLAPGLEVHINSIISGVNHFEMVALANWVQNHPYLAGIFFNIIVQPFHALRDDFWYENPGKDSDGLWPGSGPEILNALDELLELKEQGFKIDNLSHQMAAFANYLKNPQNFLHDRCPVIENALILKFDGNLYACQYHHPLGNIFEQSLDECLAAQSLQDHYQFMETCKTNCHLSTNCFFRPPHGLQR